MHGLGHPPPVSSREMKEFTTTEITITDVVISAIRIIKRMTLLVLSFSDNFNRIKIAYNNILSILILDILIDFS